MILVVVNCLFYKLHPLSDKQVPVGRSFVTLSLSSSLLKRSSPRIEDTICMYFVLLFLRRRPTGKVQDRGKEP